MDSADKLTNIFENSRELLLDDLGHLSARHFENGHESEQDASDLELQLEVGHEPKPAAEGKYGLLVLLNDAQRGNWVVVQGHGERLEEHGAVVLGAFGTLLKGFDNLGEECADQYGESLIDLSNTVLKNGDYRTHDLNTILLAFAIGIDA